MQEERWLPVLDTPNINKVIIDFYIIVKRKVLDDYDNGEADF